MEPKTEIKTVAKGKKLLGSLVWKPDAANLKYISDFCLCFIVRGQGSDFLRVIESLLGNGAIEGIGPERESHVTSVVLPSYPRATEQRSGSQPQTPFPSCYR